MEYGKSVLKEVDFYGGKKKEYWLKQNGGLSHRELLKADIDTALAQSTNFKAFEIRLKDMGYVIQRDENFAHYFVKAPSWQRAVRLDRLGKEYAGEENKRNASERTQKVSASGGTGYKENCRNRQADWKGVWAERSRQTLEEAKQKATDLRLLLRTLREMTKINELTPTLVNSLIERIEVCNNDKLSGHCYVKVDIYFTAVGMIDISTEQEILAMMEEIRANPQDFRFVA